jgi:hypothetical protein
MSKGIRISQGFFLAAGLAGILLSSIPAAQASDTSFASQCMYSHSAPDDPIVFPNQPGASHRHDFFGNTSTNASSSYNSLVNAGTTCHLEGDTGSYWSPALYDSGRLVAPHNALVYYRVGGKDRDTIRAFPAGLQVVAKDQNVRTFWGCGTGTGDSGSRQANIPTCSNGTHLVLRYRFPDCWDGSNLDSADHTSHMAFARGGDCPSSHRRPLPMLTMNIHYPGSDGGDVVLGSPNMPVTPHADFFNSWDQEELRRLVRVCLNAGRSCQTKPPG